MHAAECTRMSDFTTGYEQTNKRTNENQNQVSLQSKALPQHGTKPLPLYLPFWIFTLLFLLLLLAFRFALFLLLLLLFRLFGFPGFILQVLRLRVPRRGRVTVQGSVAGVRAPIRQPVCAEKKYQHAWSGTLPVRAPRKVKMQNAEE